MSRSPLVFYHQAALTPPSPSDKTADADRLRESLRKAGYGEVGIPLDVMRRLPAVLRSGGYGVKVLLGRAAAGYAVIDIGRDRAFGMAVDIGSTNIEASLFDLSTGRKVDETGTENPQILFGPDVLTRVQRSMLGETEPLVAAVRNGVGRLTASICSRNGIHAEDIVAVTVAGNTIMTHFFLGLPVENIPLSPYVPACSSTVYASPGDVGLKVHPKAVVYAFPNAGSYVGGDIISGILCCGIMEEESPVLFIDVGTNVEVTLCCRDWIMVGAGAAGPALEGGVAGIGRKADPGTISRVRIDRDTHAMHFDVIGAKEPEGICGSGLIDLVAEMFTSGIIDASGRFTGAGPGYEEIEGQRRYTIHRRGDHGLHITENEIRNFILSKGAMFSFLYVFVKSVGLAFADIRKVYISGALGCGINPESAVAIGMLPDIPRDRFIALGNSSLRGAEMLLMDGSLGDVVDGIARKITYREMNEDNELMNVLQGALFIPHTQPELLKGN